MSLLSERLCSNDCTLVYTSQGAGDKEVIKTPPQALGPTNAGQASMPCSQHFKTLKRRVQGTQGYQGGLHRGRDPSGKS